MNNYMISYIERIVFSINLISWFTFFGLAILIIGLSCDIESREEKHDKMKDLDKKAYNNYKISIFKRYRNIAIFFIIFNLLYLIFYIPSDIIAGMLKAIN